MIYRMSSVEYLYGLIKMPEADEFDPPPNVLNALVQSVLTPLLESAATKMSIAYVAKIVVCVRDEHLPKISLSQSGIGVYDTEENTIVRIRFRRTLRDDRLRFVVETQHSHWRQTGFSGFHCRGDIKLDGSLITPRLNGKAELLTSGWRGW